MGNSGLKLSEIALGSWLTAGLGVERDTAIACIRRAVELGVNYFDCADVYAERRAEQVTAEALMPYRREDYVLASKCFFPASDNVLDRGLSRQHIFTSVHKTLKNFRSDYVDLFYCHRHDEDTPVEETVRAFEDLIRQGKVLYWGVSEWSASQIDSAVSSAARINSYAPRVNQPQYNMLVRDIEQNGVLDTCRERGLGLAVFSPLCQGLLTGKYRGGRKPNGSRLDDDRQNRFLKDRMTDANLKRVDAIGKLADEAGWNMADLALAWCLRRPELTCAIVGASRVEQVEANVAAAERTLSADLSAKLDAI
jgi:aryl-alcohol dehydrogenase-like predicted oxidoreductase